MFDLFYNERSLNRGFLIEAYLDKQGGRSRREYGLFGSNIYPAPMLSLWASRVAQMIKNPPAMRETWVQSLGWEDPLEKGAATHSSILAWRIPWTEEPGRL